MRPFIFFSMAVTIAGGATSALGQDAKEGETQFKRVCFACHTSEAGKNKLGPSLFGIVGRKSGTVAGFNYSDAMKKAAVTWDDDGLDKYIADPKASIPGNKMAYAGVKKPEDRKNIIAYLNTLK